MLGVKDVMVAGLMLSCDPPTEEAMPSVPELSIELACSLSAVDKESIASVALRQYARYAPIEIEEWLLVSSESCARGRSRYSCCYL